MSVLALEQAHVLRLGLEDLDQLGGRVVSGGSLVDEDNDLLAHVQDADQVVEDDLVHDVVASLRIPHFFDTVERALEGRGSEAAVEAEGSLLVSLDELGHVFVVRQRG